MGDVNVCWLNVGKAFGEQYSDVVLKVRGCNREERGLDPREIDFFRSNKKVNRVIEHRWFGLVWQDDFGSTNKADLYGSNLPPMTHNFHEVVSGNYSMLYTPYLMGK